MRERERERERDEKEKKKEEDAHAVNKSIYIYKILGFFWVYV